MLKFQTKEQEIYTNLASLYNWPLVIFNAIKIVLYQPYAILNCLFFAKTLKRAKTEPWWLHPFFCPKPFAASYLVSRRCKARSKPPPIQEKAFMTQPKQNVDPFPVEWRRKCMSNDIPCHVRNRDTAFFVFSSTLFKHWNERTTLNRKSPRQRQFQTETCCLKGMHIVFSIRTVHSAGKI